MSEEAVSPLFSKEALTKYRQHQNRELPDFNLFGQNHLGDK